MSVNGSDPRTIIRDNADVLEVFLLCYMSSVSVKVCLIESAGNDQFAELHMMAFRELVDIDSMTADSEFVDFDRIIQAAPSLEFLVRYARKAGDKIIPVDVIPSDEVVRAALRLFHASAQDDLKRFHAMRQEATQPMAS